MCGRYVLTVPRRKIARAFSVPEPLLPFDIEPRYNIAPTQSVLAVRQPEPDANREGVLLKWGLVPPWAKDPNVGVKHINARSETAAEKPSFRHGNNPGWESCFRPGTIRSRPGSDSTLSKPPYVRRSGCWWP